MRPRRIRHQFYLPEALSERLDALVAVPGVSKTSILTDALTAWLERRADDELEARFGRRLDRLERQLALSIELVGVFMQHQVTLAADQPPFGPEAQRVGRERFLRLLELVEERLAGAPAASVAARAARPATPRGRQ